MALYEALPPDEQDAAYERICEARLREQKIAETELAMHRRATELLKESMRPKGGSRRSR